MFLKSINVVNNYIIWNIHLDFLDIDWNPNKTIIIAGENGTWKTTILNIISNLAPIYSPLPWNEVRTYEILLWDNEVSELEIASGIWQGILNQHLTIIKDKKWFKAQFNSLPNNWQHHLNPIAEIHKALNKIITNIFSEVEINYQSQSKNSITAKIIDEEISGSVKPTKTLADDITQLFIDIENQDNRDFKLHHEKKLENYHSRLDRFKNAFHSIFPKKKFLWISVENNVHNVVFEENTKISNINELSSWEKQIVFRAWYILQHQSNIIKNNNLVIIDEPETSLHPKWQQSIIKFYENILTINDNQKSQLIVCTHSPYVFERVLSTSWYWVIILGKDNIWNIVIKNTKNENINLFQKGNATAAEVNYYCFDIISNEFHNELYTHIEWQANNLWLSFDNYIKTKSQVPLAITLQPRIREYMDKSQNPAVKRQRTDQITLSTYIRHEYHHQDNGFNIPINEEQLKNSIEFMLSII